MEQSELNCRICGDAVDPRRVELGYDYCLKEECQRRCVKRVELAAVAVNKAADYYTTAEEVRPPRSTTTASIDSDDDGAPARSRTTRESGGRSHRPETTLERLRRMEADMDEALRRSYERFQRGEMTAREMERECDALVEAFNRHVMSENIRYRSMLRKRSAGRSRRSSVRQG
jgi:hypothetical protein